MSEGAVNSGGQAFPCLPPLSEGGSAAPGYPYPDSGMTLRQWWAGQVMPGVVATMAAPVGGRDRTQLADHLCDAVEDIVDAMMRRFGP